MTDWIYAIIRGSLANKFSRFCHAAKFICDFQSLIQFLPRPCLCLLDVISAPSLSRSIVLHQYTVSGKAISKTENYEIPSLKRYQCGINSLVLRYFDTKYTFQSWSWNSDKRKRQILMLGAEMTNDAWSWYFWAQGRSLRAGW